MGDRLIHGLDHEFVPQILPEDRQIVVVIVRQTAELLLDHRDDRVDNYFSERRLGRAFFFIFFNNSFTFYIYLL